MHMDHKYIVLELEGYMLTHVIARSAGIFQICQVLDLSKSAINYLASMPLQALELLGSTHVCQESCGALLQM